MASEPQPLDSLQLIRRKRVGEGADMAPDTPENPPEPIEQEPSLRMKPREIAPLAAVHVRIPEDIARGLKLMSVLETRQAQVIVAEAIETKLDAWNPRWRESVVSPRG